MSEPASAAAWLASNPPPDDAFRQSLAGVARRVIAGESFDLAVRELLDELALLARADQRERALAEEPPLTRDPRHDAYLAALGEHFALRFGTPRPAWTVAPERFLASGSRATCPPSERPRSPSRRRPSGGGASSSPRERSSAADMTREEIVEALTAVGRVLHGRGI